MSFIKAYDFINLRKKLFLIYALNVLDIIYTLMLLETGLFIEANLIMRNILEIPFAGIFVKVIIVLIMIVFLSINIRYASINQLIRCNVFFCITIFIYCLINLSHFIWVLLLYSI